jgi:hypothetical protein
MNMSCHRKGPHGLWPSGSKINVNENRLFGFLPTSILILYILQHVFFLKSKTAQLSNHKHLA